MKNEVNEQQHYTALREWARRETKEAEATLQRFQGVIEERGLKYALSWYLKPTLRAHGDALFLGPVLRILDPEEPAKGYEDDLCRCIARELAMSHGKLESGGDQVDDLMDRFRGAAAGRLARRMGWTQ